MPVYLTIASKYVLTYEGRHVFNPSMFGVATSLLLTRELVTAAPAYQWAGSTIGMSAFLIMAALVLFVFRIGKTPLIVSFVLLYALQTALRAWILRFHMPPEMLFLGTLSAPPFFLFTFYMITDPATSPKTARGQVGLALALTVVDLWLHTRESVFTFFYAALICAGARFVFLHAQRLWRERGNLAARLAPSAGALVRIVGVGGVGVLLVAAARLPAGATANRIDVPFRMEAVPASHTGIHTAVSDGGMPVLHDADGSVKKTSAPKEIRSFDGRDYVLEPAITGDYAIVKAWRGDRFGNLVYRHTAMNFNPMMAMAGKVTIAEVEELVEVGNLDPDHIHTPGIFVQRVIVGEKFEKRIERRTVRKDDARKEG